MCQAKSGSVSVVNQRGRLTGVFTDGDLRRHMSMEGDVLTQTPGRRDDAPPHLHPRRRARGRGLKIFNQRNIDDLIVVNAKHEPVGLIDLQDLPKLKLM